MSGEILRYAAFPAGDAGGNPAEEETGTWSRPRHKHNGYFAGDFGDAPFRPLARVWVEPGEVEREGKLAVNAPAGTAPTR